MKDVIAIGADHYNTLWLMRSLGMAGLQPTAIIVGAKEGKSFVAVSKYCKKAICVDSKSDIIPALRALPFIGRIPVIASGDAYAEVLDANYDMLSERFALCNCDNRQGGIIYWMNKSRMLAKAKEVGLLTPQTMTITPDGGQSVEDVIFPCLVKPETSAQSSKDAFRVCNDKAELLAAIADAKDEHLSVLVQQYIKADYELLVYGVRTMDNRVVLPGGLKKLHTCGSTNNMGMTAYGCITKDISGHGISRDSVLAYLDDINYHGIFSMEFMIAEGKAYFLEINMRNDGTVYCTTKAGVNIPAIWSLSATGGGVEGLPTSLQRQKTFCMNEVNYAKYTLLHQNIVKSLRELFQTSAFSLFEIKDMKPAIYKIMLPLVRRMGGG